jgi:hypothetical protein
MLSTIVFCEDKPASAPGRDLAEVLARTLASLVTAKVEGLLGDVRVAGPAEKGLGVVTNHAGCALIEAESEAEWIYLALQAARGPEVFLLRCGRAPEAGFIEEAADFLAANTKAQSRAACLRAAPESFLERMPQFVRMNMKGLVSGPAQTLVDELSESIGHNKFKSEKAEVAGGIYAISHFVERAAVRFLLLFVSLETLLVRAARADDAQEHVQSLIEATQKANISSDDREAIASALRNLKDKSIGQLGRELATKLLPGETYESMNAAAFFNHIRKLRNDMVHRGKIDPSAIHAVLGETDRFVSDLLKHHYVDP